MWIRSLSGLVASALTLCVFVPHAAAQTQLRWKLASGQVLNQNLVQDSDTSMSFNGQMINTKMTVTMNTIWKVNQVDQQGTADITQSFASIKFKMTSPAFSLDYDSASGTEPTDPIGQQIAKSVKPLTQAKFNLKMSARGEITEVKATEESQKLLQQAQPAGPQAGGGPLTQDGIVAMIKESVIPFPATPVQKGATWQHKSEMKAPPIGSMANDSVLTYDGTVNVSGKQLEQIKIATKSKLTVAGDNPAVQVSLKDQSKTGTIFFDNAAGRISHSDSVQNIVMEVNAGGQKFDQTIKTVEKMTITPAANK